MLYCDTWLISLSVSRYFTNKVTIRPVLVCLKIGSSSSTNLRLRFDWLRAVLDHELQVSGAEVVVDSLDDLECGHDLFLQPCLGFVQVKGLGCRGQTDRLAAFAGERCPVIVKRPFRQFLSWISSTKRI